MDNQELLNKLNSLKFSFDENDVIDYQYLLTLIYQNYTNQNPDPQICQSIGVIMNLFNNIYNWESRLEPNTKDIDIKNINNIQNYILLFLQIRYDLNESNNQKISSGTIDNIEICLSNLDQTYIPEQEETIVSPKVEEINITPQSVFISQQQQPTFQTLILQDKMLNKDYLKTYLYFKHKREYKCDICGLSEWQNEPLNLIVDFIDRNLENQNVNNLRFLCPNCFSQVGYNG